MYPSLVSNETYMILNGLAATDNWLHNLQTGRISKGRML